jgi:hypothetical protein
LGLAKNIQSENCPDVGLQVTQGTARSLGINYLHSAWRPQVSRKVERDNQTLKRMLAQLCQQTSEFWVTLQPISLLSMKNSPRPQIHLSPYVILYGRLFLSDDLLINSTVNDLIRYITTWVRSYRPLTTWGKMFSPPHKKGKNSKLL